MLSCSQRPSGNGMTMAGNCRRSAQYYPHSANGMRESTIAKALAEVMLYNDQRKAWESPEGGSGLSTVQILQNVVRHSFRIVAVSEQDGSWVLNCNVHHRLKYYRARPTFHQWRDEQRQVFGLNFVKEEDAQHFEATVAHAIDYLNQPSDYQTIQHDNVYQDPHQHMVHNQSAPALREQEDQLHPNFRKASQPVGGNLSQQASRRASQGSSASSNGGNYAAQQQQPSAASPCRAPPAPPPPPSGGPSGPPPAPPLPTASVSSSAPPAPPPPPANLMNSVAQGGPSFADQIKAASQAQLKKTSTAEPPKGRSNSMAEPQDRPTAAPPNDLFSELTKTINKRKMNQAKADAADSKSNISNGSGSSDSGCAIAPPSLTSTSSGISNGVKKWEPVRVNGHAPSVNGTAAHSSDSPKTHRKAPSGSSISSQEEVVTNASNKLNGLQTPVSAEFLERFKAEMMLEVRSELSKMKMEIIEAVRAEISKR